jgi:regulator of ribonuclease activity A
VAKTADLCDEHEGVQSCACQFRSWGQRRAFSGRIRTLRCHEDILLLRQMVSEPGAGCVLVVDGGGSLNRALFGDTMAANAAKNGWAGVVVNGAARDVAEIENIDIGLKALGLNPRRGEKKGTGAIDVPVWFGNATFTPGRWLVADEDGVVVLPKGMTDAV